MSRFLPAVVVIALISPLAFADWPVFRGDATMTGVGTAKLPDQLAERWTFKTGDAIEGAPVIVGNTVYVASLGKHLFALDLATGKQKWKVDLTYRLVGHRYEWVGDYQCNTLMPNVVSTNVTYRDLSARASMSVNHYVTLMLRGEHLLQPKIDASQWATKAPDPVNDTQRTYGIPAYSPTYSLEFQLHF